jgi:hypothetical protein
MLSFVCNDTDDVLIGVGSAFVAAGSTGMSVSRIILGVANKRAREHRREQRVYSSRPVRYDPHRVAFVF